MTTSANATRNKTDEYCTCCKKFKDKRNFYKSYNPMHSSGVTPFCKKCIKDTSIEKDGTINIEKFKYVLQQIDRPFLADIYQTSVESGMDIIGVYFKNIAMPQYRYLTWSNSDFGISSSNNSDIDEDGVVDSTKVYSKKWRGAYNKIDLEYLDNYYKELDEDFNIVTKNHKDYAKKIAKASLAMDKAYEDMLNGVSGSDKRYKDLKDIFDSLSKSAQFSESQRGANDAGISGISQVVDKVENKQWIFEVENFPEDAIDHLLYQFSNIEKSL